MPGFDLLERGFDQGLVVLLRHLPLEDLRGNRDGQINRLVANLLYRARRFELDLLLGVLHNRRRLGA